MSCDTATTATFDIAGTDAEEFAAAAEDLESAVQLPASPVRHRAETYKEE